MALRARRWLRDRAELVGLLLMLALGACLRFGWTGVSPFAFDEARVSDLALQMVREHHFATLGMPSSTGVPNFPATVWLYTLPFAVSTNPQVAIGFTSLLNVLAIAGMWWLAREAWGKWSGFCVALLFASSPYLVFYSRSIWSQDLLAPFAVLWAVSAVAGIRRDSPLWLALHGFLAGFVGQLHLAGFCLAIASVWIGLRFRLWRRWLAILLGASLAFLATVPTLRVIACCGQGIKTDLARILAQKATLGWDSVRQLGQMGAGMGMEWFWLNGQPQWPAALTAALRLSQILLGLVILAGAMAVAGAMLRRRGGSDRAQGEKRGILAAFVLPWAVSAPLVFLRSKTPVYIYYQLASLPALFLCAGAWVGWRQNRAWQRGWATLLLLCALVQSAAMARTLSSLRDTSVPGGLPAPLLYPQAAANALIRDGLPIVVETSGDQPAYDGDATVFQVLLWGHPHRLVDARSALILPPGPAQLFFIDDALPAWEVAQELAIGGTVREFPRRQGEPSYWAITLQAPHVSGFTPITPVRLANGATLLGWEVQSLKDGARWRLITHWQISQPEQGTFQQFNHLFVVGKSEAEAMHDVYTASRAWQDGDQLITWADFDRPQAAPLHFYVGMYRWPEIERILRLDHDGDPYAPIELDLTGIQFGRTAAD